MESAQRPTASAVLLLRRALRQRTAHIAPTDLARLMGYANARRRTLDRIAGLADDPWLGLAGSGYDLRYGSRGFLLALCRTVAIDAALCRRAIEAIERELQADRGAYQPWLFVDTSFRREARPGMSLTILGMLEPRRRLSLSTDLHRLALTDQLERAGRRVCEHMAATGGEIPVWGTIHRYWFVYREGCAIALSPDARVLGETSRFNPPGAAARVGHRRLDPGTLFAGDP